MEVEEICSFLDITADKLDSCWDSESLVSIASQRVPDFIMSGRGSLLRADINILWTQWFIESICDPESFANSNQSYAHVVEAVRQRIPFVFPEISNPEKQKLTSHIAKLVFEEVKRRRRKKRIVLSLEIKRFLWDISGNEPRCWICGYKFNEWAKNKFLGNGSVEEPPLARFIDYMTLHGLRLRDICVEVDHVLPVSKGGREEDNLRLACGWCNTYKSNCTSVYDVEIKPRTITHPKFALQSIPHPFWVVRLLSVRRRCEHEGGCDKSVDNSHLTIVPKHPGGAMNPTNLRVICKEHDPLGSHRLVSREILDK